LNTRGVDRPIVLDAIERGRRRGEDVEGENTRAPA
jgi:hypothetical protein